MSEETAGRRAQTSEEGELRQIEAAEMPQLSYRQVQRIYRRFRKSGAKGLVHGKAHGHTRRPGEGPGLVYETNAGQLLWPA